MNRYRHRPWKVVAEQWKGNNRAEIEAFAADWIPGVELTFLSDDSIRFTAWGEDQVVDVNDHIVVSPGIGGTDGVIFTNREFEVAFELDTRP